MNYYLTSKDSLVFLAITIHEVTCNMLHVKFICYAPPTMMRNYTWTRHTFETYRRGMCITINKYKINNINTENKCTVYVYKMQCNLAHT